MRKYLVLLLACIACWSLISLGFRGGNPKRSPNTISTAAVVHFTPAEPKYYTVAIYCCDTGRQGPLPPPPPPAVIFSKLALLGISPEDSVWIQHLPDTLLFSNMSSGDAKTIKLSMPGIQMENVKTKGAKK